MKEMRNIVLLMIPLLFNSCLAMKNFDKPVLGNKNEGSFFTVRDGTQLFVYEYQPIDNYNSTIFVISGITGINHHREKDVIDLLANNENRIVVIHPRGTGYSEGSRGDIAHFNDFITDYSEIIRNDRDYGSEQHNIILFGHSMACSVLLAAARSLHGIAGAILVNPPSMLKAAKGMSPSFGQYIKYAAYYLFANHTPVVTMAGNPIQMENEEDRKESESRIHDRLLVKYFSISMLMESKLVMDSMIDFSKTANYPLLLIYGERDNIVDKKGCDLIFDNWGCPHKQYVLMQNGSHGKSTVKQARDIIDNWMKSINGLKEQL